jgi:hypothetical protein
VTRAVAQFVLPTDCKLNLILDVWKQQIPTTFPDYDNVQARDIENYCLVLVAIEENLQERQKLKAEIEKVGLVLLCKTARLSH